MSRELFWGDMLFQYWNNLAKSFKLRAIFDTTEDGSWSFMLKMLIMCKREWKH